MTIDGREFEKLIARIEGGLVPKGAQVKTPDHIRDKFTGQMREVDVSIRYQIGSVPILLTIEYRDRSGVEDVTWIEQIATKRESIGAAKTIAVSSSGFTGPAIKIAQLKGIEIRRISDITEQEIGELLLIDAIVNVVNRSILVDVSVNVEGEETSTPTAFSARVKDHSVQDFLNMMEGTRDFSEIPEDGTRVRRTFRAEFGSSRGTIETETGTIGVKGVDMTLEMFREKIVVPVSKFLSYSDDTQRLLVAGEATATIVGKKIVFTVIQKAGSKECILGIAHNKS